MIDVCSGNSAAEADHGSDRRIAVLAHPGADRRRLERCGAPGTGRRAGISAALARAVERVARHDDRIAIRLRQHPHVRQAIHRPVVIPDSAVALRVMILEKHHGFIGRHQPPRRLGELVPRGPGGVELSDPLPTVAQELVADAAELELSDVGGAA